MSLNKMIEIKKIKMIASYIASTAMLLTLAGNSFAEATLSVAFESSYYGIAYVPGLYVHENPLWDERPNYTIVPIGGVVRLSFKPIENIQLRFSVGKLVGKSSFEGVDILGRIYGGPDKGKLTVTEIPIELQLAFPVEVPKECYIYLSFGVLFCHSKFIQKLREDDEWTERKIQGTVWGFPVIFGVERRIFEHWGLFGECYLLFPGSIKASWNIEDAPYEAENGLSSKEAFRRIRFGLSYLF